MRGAWKLNMLGTFLRQKMSRTSDNTGFDFIKHVLQRVRDDVARSVQAFTFS